MTQPCDQANAGQAGSGRSREGFQWRKQCKDLALEGYPQEVWTSRPGFQGVGLKRTDRVMALINLAASHMLYERGVTPASLDHTDVSSVLQDAFVDVSQNPARKPWTNRPLCIPSVMRAVQGHSRSDVHDDDLLERCTEETLPGVLLHGTKWHLYEAIRDQGILPQALLAQEQGRSGKGKKGSEGRRHVHLIPEEDRGKDVLSGFRENATMVIAVDARHAMRQGVTFYRSKHGVILTSDRIPSASILFYESLKDNQKYDRRGKPM